ncbi:hypothetical protein [Actinoplanes sp. NPDC051859]|uniref:hypothetical protein n=1 Tax=Actinoplanes sp. NPDC051859 TaxID=3363909 RepID=UPI0037895D13
MTTTSTPALVGRFQPDARNFLARPVRTHGQPTHTLVNLALLYCWHSSGAPMVTNLLMARDWAEINVTAHPRPRDPRHEWVRGFGHGYRLGADVGLVAGHVGEDQPWRRGEWAYLWEHEHGALHVYLAARARWHHLATVDFELLRGMGRQCAEDIEMRTAWVEAVR